jgi:hypothetical protein
MRNLRLLFVIAVCVLTPTVARAQGGWLDWLYSMDNRFLGSDIEVNLRCKGDTGWHWFCGENVPGDLALLAVGKKNLISHKVSFDKVKHEFDLRVGYYHTFITTASSGVDTDSMNAGKLGLSYYYHLPDTRWFALDVGPSVSVIRFSGDHVHTVWAGIGTLDAKLIPAACKFIELHVTLSGYSRGLTGAAIASDGKVAFLDEPEGKRVTIAAGVNFWR